MSTQDLQATLVRLGATQHGDAFWLTTTPSLDAR